MNEKDLETYLKATGWVTLGSLWFSKRSVGHPFTLQNAVKAQLVEEEARLGFVFMLASPKSKAFLATCILEACYPKFMEALQTPEFGAALEGFITSSIAAPEMQPVWMALKAWLQTPAKKE